ncbi:MAG: DAK2 domain-containing protein [Eubacterium sp.]|nr:DAK2 domain-containing protein [Eubacterium sp.]
MLIQTIDASLIRRAFLAGANALDANKDIVNELNVFPVPDGDTGTNMTMTIMSAAKEVSALPEKPEMKALCKAISGGSLKGARGNSGVILSQLLRGFTKVIRDEEQVDVELLQAAFDRAVAQAYKAVMKPKEGTILTVARAGAEKAFAMSETTDNIIELVNSVLIYMEDVLEQTPDMLPVLKEAGVVDSGGRGLMYFLQGCYDVLLGKDVNTDITDRQPAAGKPQKKVKDTDSIHHVYCTSFVLIPKKPLTAKNEKSISEHLHSIGEEVRVDNEDECLSIHLHTNDPGMAIQRALTYGSLKKIRILNMREGEKDDAPGQEGSSGASSTQDSATDAPENTQKQDSQPEPEKMPHKENAFISVSAGDGISEIFRDLGVDIIIEGGQTMNPSTEDILNAINRLDADHIFILPNNGNILLAANQAKSMSEGQDVIVIQSKNIPQGVAAMVGFIDGVSAEDNETAMNEALSAIREGEVTYAVRDTSVDGHDIKKGDIMGICGKKITAVGTDVIETTVELIKSMLDEDSELVTLYYGEESSEEDAAQIASRVGLERLDVEFEIQSGGQPIYYYFISVE